MLIRRNNPDQATESYMPAAELHEIWLQQSDARRYAFVLTLSDDAAARLLAFQLDRQSHNYSGDPHARRSEGGVPVVTVAAPEGT